MVKLKHARRVGLQYSRTLAFVALQRRQVTVIPTSVALRTLLVGTAFGRFPHLQMNPKLYLESMWPACESEVENQGRNFAHTTRGWGYLQVHPDQRCFGQEQADLS